MMQYRKNTNINDLSFTEYLVIKTDTLDDTYQIYLIMRIITHI